MSLPLSDAVFAILRSLVEERIGMQFDENQRDILGEKASTRATELGFESLLDYYYYLRYDPAGAGEMQALAEHLVVRETYFFRELEQLQMVVRHLIAPRVRAGEPLRVWSAACATGEEPLTLAMLLAHEGLLEKVEIVASDLSARSLETARAGRFGPRSVRLDALPAAAHPFLSPRPEGGYRVAPALVDRIRWERINLKDREAIRTLGHFDVVLCRNVLIYFGDRTTREVLESLVERLEPGGALLVGVSESLLRFGTALVCEEHGGAFCYRKAPR